MDQHKYRTAGVQEKLEIIGVEDEAGNPISALTILSLLERVAGIIDNVQSSQQRMEERQLELENNIKTIQGDVLKLAKDHTDTSGTVEKLLQKTRKVSANVKEVRTRVEKQNSRVKKVESTQDELLTRNKFRVVIYQVSRGLDETAAECKKLKTFPNFNGGNLSRLFDRTAQWKTKETKKNVRC